MKISSLILIGISILTSQVFGVEKGRMIYGESTQVNQFDPYTVREIAGHRMADLLFDSLVVVGPGGAIKPHLAKDWTIENGGTAISIKLREKVFWHKEGNQPLKPVTADDVATTVRLITSPNSEIANGKAYQSISHVDIISRYSIRIHFNRALSQPLRHILFKVLPHHKLDKVKALSAKTAFSKHPIGTGPYAFFRSTPQGEVLLKKNNFYFKRTPNIKEIVMKPYLDRNVMTQSLLYSSLDLIPYISPKYLPEVQGDRNLGLIPYAAQSFSFVGINTSRRALTDRKVRQAISHAINRQEMLQAFFQGQGHLISGPFSPSSWAYNLAVEGFAYDPIKAKELLQSAGYEDRNQDGILENRNGHKLNLSFAVPLTGEQESIKRIVLAMQSYLQAVGIKTQLRFLEWQVWKDEVLGKRNYDLTIASWDFDDSANITSLFHSRSVKAWGNNFVAFRNADIDSMLMEAKVTNDFDKRRMIYKELHRSISQEAPYVFLWTLKHHAAHSQSLTGLRVEPFSFFKHVAQWKVRD